MAEKKIQIRVDEALWFRLDDKRHNSRQDWQEIGLSLWKQWLDGEQPSVQRSRPQAKNEEWHRKLDLILDQGTERDRIGIQQNLEWTAEHVSSATPRKRQTGS